MRAIQFCWNGDFPDLPNEICAQLVEVFSERDSVQRIVRRGTDFESFLDELESRARRLIGVAGNNDGPALWARLGGEAVRDFFLHHDQYPANRRELLEQVQQHRHGDVVRQVGH